MQTDHATNDENSNQNIDQDDDNDWITLNGCSHVTYWRFPQTTSCPSVRCSLTFPNRKMAKRHYIEVHAKYMILCPNCNKPINAKMSLNFLKHHREMHPNVAMPYEFMIKRTTKVHRTTVIVVANMSKFQSNLSHLFKI